MIDNNIIKLENGYEYRVVDKIENKDISYVYLINIVDKNDLVIRKEISEEENNYLVLLSSKEELELALKLYMEKNG